MDTDTFILHRYNGDEIYAVKSATLEVFQRDGVIELFLYIKTKSKPIKTLPDTAELNPRPNAEVYVAVDTPDVSKLVGQRFLIPNSWNEEKEDHVSCIYYCEHNDLNENVVQILEEREKRFLIHWTGTTTDVNFYDGSKPATRVEIKAWFALKKKPE